MGESRIHHAPAGSGQDTHSQGEHPQEGLIREELNRILHSHPFKSSKRSQHFLKHVVENALAGRTDAMKERTIGVAVFDRDPSYDTGEDATVRVAANEVRKRLAQYHGESPNRDVRIELPLGSYVPEFQIAANCVGGGADQGGMTRNAGFLSKRLGMALLAGVLALAAFAVYWRPAVSPFEEFWHPLTATPKPVLVCMAHPRVFHVMGRLQNEYKSKGYNDTPATKTDGRSVSVELQPGDIVQTEQYVGGGDAYAAGLFSAQLTRMRKNLQLRIGNDVSFGELRSSPAVLIGAYSNRWTMQSNEEYRFGFGPHSVVDRAGKGREWKLSEITPDYRAAEDYAIVSRVLRSYSGEPVVTAAGTTNMGTRAAAEFLTNPVYLNEALSRAPAGWQDMNLQLVLHCKVIGSTPGPAKVIASHFW